MTTDYLSRSIATISVVWLFVQTASGGVPALKIETLLEKRIVQWAQAGRSALAPDFEYSIESDEAADNSPTESHKEDEKEPDFWRGGDKCRHFILSGFWSGFGYLVCYRHLEYSQGKSLLIAGGSVLSFGVAKEVRDGLQPANRFSYKDLLFDLLGIGCGLFIASR